MLRILICAGALALPLALPACQMQDNRVLSDGELETARRAARQWADTWDADVVLVAPVDFAPLDGWVSATVQPRAAGAEPIALRCQYRTARAVCETVVKEESSHGR